jgi:hypothetical protein
MGHALGFYFHAFGPKSQWLIPHPQPRSALLSPCNGDLGTPTEMCYWDLLHYGGMAGFIKTDGSRPTFMSSITRRYMGFLNYTDATIGDTVWIDALETNTAPMGTKAVRVFSVKDAQQCYVLEVRTKNAKYSFWDQALPQTSTSGTSDAWLVIYLINNNNAETECGDIIGKDDDAASTAQDIVVQWILDVPWIIDHPEYPVVDPINGVSFNVEKSEMTDDNIRVRVLVQGVH